MVITTCSKDKLENFIDFIYNVCKKVVKKYTIVSGTE